MTAEVPDDIRRTVVVGLVADPGLPTELARTVADQLPDELSRKVGDGVAWRVETASQILHLDGTGRPTIPGDGTTLKDRGWDMMVALTELPLRRDRRPMISEVDTSLSTAWVSLAALGGFWLRSSLLRALVTVIKPMSPAEGVGVHPEETPHEEDTSVPRTGASTGVDGRDMELDAETVHVGGSRFRLLTGMVRINRPWHLVGSLDNVFAAAAATGAFGVFYASVWNMTDTLSILRLALINVAAIAALVGWLILHNGLWERPHARGGATTQPRLYNAVTVVSLLVGVAAMYVLLFLATLLGALTVISSEYLETVLGHPVTAVEYVKIAWIASSMGTVAGALGSNFESQADVKRVAYGRRQLDRF